MTDRADYGFPVNDTDDGFVTVVLTSPDRGPPPPRRWGRRYVDRLATLRQEAPRVFWQFGFPENELAFRRQAFRWSVPHSWFEWRPSAPEKTPEEWAEAELAEYRRELERERIADDRPR